ncbi:hypothetical protein ABZU86_10330 [Streptomyces sp. NPDC005271]|uniref:hypothetical protein n=1 Tax=unclassified Streptomyces TaxID=2593676 RepID=UPI0033AE9EA5
MFTNGKGTEIVNGSIKGLRWVGGKLKWGALTRLPEAGFDGEKITRFIKGAGIIGAGNKMKNKWEHLWQDDDSDNTSSDGKTPTAVALTAAAAHSEIAAVVRPLPQGAVACRLRRVIKMSTKHPDEDRMFIGDDGKAHELIPSQVIASIPEAKAKAEELGREVRIDFLNDRAVLWMLHQRWGDNADKHRAVLVLGLPFILLSCAMWPFWVLVASEKPQPFKMITIGVAVAVLGTLLFFWCRHGLRATFDPVRRNVRIRARMYRKVVGTTRGNGADIPHLYPHYGMYATSRKFFPDAEDLPIPEDLLNSDATPKEGPA